MKLRFFLILVLFLLFGILLLSRIFFIQIRQHGFYLALAEGQQKWFKEQQGERGSIFARDRRGNVYELAKTIKVVSVWARIDQIDELKLAELSSRLRLELKELSQKLAQAKEKEQELLLLKELETGELKLLSDLKTEGLVVREQTKRVYPFADFASQLLGFLGGEGEGQYGIEGFYDEQLEGKTGLVSGERNPWGFALGILQNEAQKGADLYLTIDYNLQLEVERLLEDYQSRLGFEAGQVIIQDPGSGRILALAHWPSFDLNSYSKVKDVAIYQNGAVQKIFEPGSVFKPVVMAAALEHGKITPDTTYLDRGRAQIGSYTIYNYAQRVFGQPTMREVLEKSINTGAVFAEKQVGHEKFLEMIKQLGFLEKTEIDLHGEIFSENKNLRTFRDINFATASFGQGIEVNAMQLVRAFAVFANGGKLFQPLVAEKIAQPNGNVVEIKPKLQQEKIITSQTQKQLTDMLVSVLEQGFGRQAKIPDYWIAGKTGTAQVAWAALGEQRAGYSEKTVQSFIGYFPAYDPKFLVLVKLDNPATQTAEYSALPLFRDTAKYIIDYWPLAPDYDINNR